MVDVPRLYLITPPVDDAAAFMPLLETALKAADVACLLVRAAARDEHGLRAVARALAPIAQSRGVAVLIEQEARVAVRLDVDGVHVSGAGAPFAEALESALSSLKPGRIVGAAVAEGRDAAMIAGEAGADYVMFGAPGRPGSHASVCEQVAWWAAIFNVPCVGYVEDPDLAPEMAAAGAEFIGLCEGLWDRPEALAATLERVTTMLSSVSEDVP
jgi:thiamine-phosphate pyrophosphorylase